MTPRVAASEQPPGGPATPAADPHVANAKPIEGLDGESGADPVDDGDPVDDDDSADDSVGLEGTDGSDHAGMATAAEPHPPMPDGPAPDEERETTQQRRDMIGQLRSMLTAEEVLSNPLIDRQQIATRLQRLEANAAASLDPSEPSTQTTDDVPAEELEPQEMDASGAVDFE